MFFGIKRTNGRYDRKDRDKGRIHDEIKYKFSSFSSLRQIQKKCLRMVGLLCVGANNENSLK